ncbi:MAG: HD domain-containing protein, partial [Acidobacteria bacterium]
MRMPKRPPSNLSCWLLAAFLVGAIPLCLLEPSDPALWLPPLTLAVLVSSPLVVALSIHRTLSTQLEREQRQVRQLSELHISTVEALARAIDAKDQQSHLHLRRIQVFAAELARVAGMSDTDARGVRTAALLHDVGQLAIPEHILAKPGPLTHEEREKVRTHPEFGAAILADVPFPYPVAPFILSHHERWDGRGYPVGLKGEDIPLGARILSVVDYFDALTSERPYHRAMQPETAVRLLEEEAGRALDPLLVAKFLGLLPRLLAETAHLGGPVASRAADDGGRSVFDEIALAHREIYTLYEIAHSMGTSLSLTETMELVTSKLTRLVPFSCCALFLLEGEGRSLGCKFARGVDADVVRRLVAGDGGAVGLVARSRRSLVNVPPREDLDAAGESAIETRLQASLLVPLVFHDRAIGTLAVYDAEPERYTENHRRLL